MLALLALCAQAPGASAVDLAGPVGSNGAHPVVLVVSSPGLAPQAYEGLGRALQAQGLDAWLLEPPAYGPAGFVDALLPAAIEDTGAVALVAEGLGGRLVAAYLSDAPEVKAAALLGPVLRFDVVALTSWLLEQPLPSQALDLAALSEATWRDRPVLPLLLGSPLPPLQPLSQGWVEALRGWLEAAEVEDLSELSLPLWVGMGGLDVLAPPEHIRPFVGGATLVRFGPSRLDGRDFDHADLLGRPQASQALAVWLAQELGQAAPAASVVSP